jgi:hypothetical protein
MEYGKAVEVENLKENAQRVLDSVAGLSPEDAMNALGAAVSHHMIKTCLEPARLAVLDGWFAMVRSSLLTAALLFVLASSAASATQNGPAAAAAIQNHNEWACKRIMRAAQEVANALRDVGQIIHGAKDVVSQDKLILDTLIWHSCPDVVDDDTPDHRR